ncbi:hypothetical protein A2U01_0107588, partial [Trifolium medium]|nr:hypothetical protein [Trifolium medium]
AGQRPVNAGPPAPARQPAVAGAKFSGDRRWSCGGPVVVRWRSGGGPAVVRRLATTLFILI